MLLWVLFQGKKKNTTWHWCFRCFVYTREGVSLCFRYCCFLLMFVRRKYQKRSCSCSIEVKLTNPDAQKAEPNQFMCWDCWRSIFSIFFCSSLSFVSSRIGKMSISPIKPQIEWGVALLFWSDQILLQPSIYPVSNIVGSSFSWLKDMESMTLSLQMFLLRDIWGMGLGIGNCAFEMHSL